MMDYRFRLVGKRQTQRVFERAAATYDRSAVLQQEVGRRLLERLEVIRIAPERVLDLGAGTGQVSADLLRRYPQAQVLALDLAPAMLRRARKRGRFWRRPLCLAADAEALPLRPGSIDLLVSNLTLPWLPDLDRAFAGFLRVLRPGGLVLFSSLGPDTLKELRQAWAEVDDLVHVHEFIDMHDVGDALVRAGFSDPVMEAEYINLTYPDLDALVRDLRETGGCNLATARRAGLTPKRAASALRTAYERWRLPDGRLPATCEIVYGHAWVPEMPVRRQTGSAIGVPVASIGRRRR